MSRVVEFLYKCSCMPRERAFYVRERLPNESIIDFMDKAVRPALSIDHRSRSPLCAATRLEYLKMPVDENKPIGAAKTAH
jgi:hypothetical protein